MSDAPLPRPAATVVLCREREGELEVYLVKRHGRSGFMAGAHVFPGGRVDEADAAFAADLADDALAAARALLDGMGAEQAVAFCVAALRETAEECGLLLARRPGGERVDDALASEVVRELRAGRPFKEALQARELTVDLAALRPFAWWVTPETEPKRYDTRFFLAAAPASQRADVDRHEATEGEWLSPAAALAAYQEGRIVLAPPTLCTLEDLVEHTTLEAAAAAAPRPVPCILPLLVSSTEGLTLALPGDPLHPDAALASPRRSRIVMGADGRFAGLLVGRL